MVGHIFVIISRLRLRELLKAFASRTEKKTLIPVLYQKAELLLDIVKSSGPFQSNYSHFSLSVHWTKTKARQHLQCLKLNLCENKGFPGNSRLIQLTLGPITIIFFLERFFIVCSVFIM